MKKSILACICLVALTMLFTACGSTPAAQTTSSSLMHKGAEESAATPTTSATGQGCEQAQTATPTATPVLRHRQRIAQTRLWQRARRIHCLRAISWPTFLSASQAPGSSITHKHVASFDYQVKGTQVVQEQGGPKQTLNPGDAVFIKNDVTHTHSNPGQTANKWYLIALRPATAQTPTPTLPNEKTIYQTPTLPTSVFSKGAYCENLLRTEVQPNGKTASQRYSGLEVLHVLDGSVKVDVAGQDPKTLKAGDSTYILPNTPVQVSNAGSDVARFLSFNAWPQGQPFREALAGIPSEVGTPVPTSTATGTVTPRGTTTPMATGTPVGTATAAATVTPTR